MFPDLTISVELSFAEPNPSTNIAEYSPVEAISAPSLMTFPLLLMCIAH